jgi:hypothetical protein
MSHLIGLRSPVCIRAEVNANENHQIWYHRVGTPQAEDVFVFATPETPKYFVGGSVSDDGRRVPTGALALSCA